MVLANRRRRRAELPLLPSLTVEIVRGNDPGRPIHAAVEKLHHDSVVVRCASGVDALAVAMSPELELHFRAPGISVSMTARPGRRVDDVHGSREVELVLDESARAVTLTG